MGKLQSLGVGSYDSDVEVGFSIPMCCFARLARDFGSIVDTGAVLRRMGCGR